MKITDVRLEGYKWPRAVPISNGKHTYTHSGRTFIFVETDEGITGIGLTGGDDGIAKAIVEYYKPQLIGQS